jgi:hypothetical protein
MSMIPYDFKRLFQSMNDDVGDSFSQLIREGHSDLLSECLDYALEHFQGEMMFMHTCELTIDNLELASSQGASKLLQEALNRGVLIDADYTKCLIHALKSHDFEYANQLMNYLEGVVLDINEVFDHQVEQGDLVTLLEELETFEFFNEASVKVWFESYISNSKLFS